MYIFYGLIPSNTKLNIAYKNSRGAIILPTPPTKPPASRANKMLDSIYKIIDRGINIIHPIWFTIQATSESDMGYSSLSRYLNAFTHLDLSHLFQVTSNYQQLSWYQI